MLMLMLTNTMETEEAGNTAGERGFNLSHLNHGVGDNDADNRKGRLLEKEASSCFFGSW